MHRYADQTRITIDNSTNSLIEENKIISKIILIIKSHPYTYVPYLNKKRLSIPNIGFFMNKNHFMNSKNLNSGIGNISNNEYCINQNNTTINSISLMVEEDGIDAKKVSAVGSSIYGSAFKKITFEAKTVIFDTSSNSFKYQTPTLRK